MNFISNVQPKNSSWDPFFYSLNFELIRAQQVIFEWKVWDVKI